MKKYPGLFSAPDIFLLPEVGPFRKRNGYSSLGTRMKKMRKKFKDTEPASLQKCDESEES